MINNGLWRKDRLDSVASQSPREFKIFASGFEKILIKPADPQK
jgi:hypothetical protein